MKDPAIKKTDLDTAYFDYINSIDDAFRRLYPNQTNPIHYGVMIPWSLGGKDPLRGISAYDGGEYYHFVTYGLSEPYEEDDNKELSGYGFEFTLKLKKDGLEDENKEIRCICGILQDLARTTFTNGEVYRPNEYIYTGQQVGIDVRQKSKLTGFITSLDEVGVIDTPNGKIQFVKLIGATDAELQAIMDKKIKIIELVENLGDMTDYTRDSIM